MSAATLPGEYGLLVRAWEIAQPRSPATARTYRLALCQFRDYLAAQGLPTTPQHIAPAHVDAYLAHMKASGKAPATVKVYGAALRAWFAWLVEQGEVPATTTLIHTPRHATATPAEPPALPDPQPSPQSAHPLTPAASPPVPPDWREQERQRAAAERVRIAGLAARAGVQPSTIRRRLKDQLAKEREAARTAARQERAFPTALAAEHQARIELARLLGELDVVAHLAANAIARIIVTAYRQELPPAERSALDQRAARAQVAGRVAQDIHRQLARPTTATPRMQRLWWKYLREWVGGYWDNPPVVALMVGRVAREPMPKTKVPPAAVRRDLLERARAESAFSGHLIIVLVDAIWRHYLATLDPARWGHLAVEERAAPAACAPLPVAELRRWIEGEYPLAPDSPPPPATARAALGGRKRARGRPWDESLWQIAVRLYHKHDRRPVDQDAYKGFIEDLARAAADEGLPGRSSAAYKSWWSTQRPRRERAAASAKGQDKALPTASRSG